MSFALSMLLFLPDVAGHFVLPQAIGFFQRVKKKPTSRSTKMASGFFGQSIIIICGVQRRRGIPAAFFN